MTENFDFDYESSIPKNPPIVTFGVDSTSNRFHYHHVGGIGSSLTGNPYASPDVLSLNSHTIPTSKNHLWKYNEEQILKDVSEYVTSTYGSHYCGQNQEYKDIQTIDLMAAKDLAQDFCQANILKYGSRYGAKNGRNKRDLMKVIHYAMLLLHFDGHYTRKDNGLSEFK